MIGVVADPSDYPAVVEFFELFKTPWERAVPTRKYRVILSTVGHVDSLRADHFLIYGSGDPPPERQAPAGAGQLRGPVDVDWAGTTFPIYGRLALFEPAADSMLKHGSQAVAFVEPSGARRIGYDLFREVHHLLTRGQPAARAATPTLEIHIALLRHLLLECGVSFVEIPPRPNGHDFACCLTHDVDFFGIRRHKFDRTLLGFIARASVGTLSDLIRGRRTLGEAARNWTAILSLPFVHLGVASDFWRPFDDYARVEDRGRSTFFVVSVKGKPGVSPDGTTSRTRAVPYEVREIGEQVRKATAQGSELAVHGIDAWRDAGDGRAELKALTSLTGRESAGVRMHWLYFDQGSPAQLEAAGFDYDSTCGHNEAVGYRAGTSQAFLLPGCARLMELPLSIMDSALFSSDRLGLTHAEAAILCRAIVANAKRFGGTVVINWHGRSLAPERLWGRFYDELVQEVSSGNRAWFARAGEAVDWFRWRRSIAFERTSADGVLVQASAARPNGPFGVIRVHHPDPQRSVQDVPFNGQTTAVDVCQPSRSHV